MNLSPGQHAFLAVGLSVIAAGLLIIILVWPALASRAAFQERREELQFQQQQLTETVARMSSLEKDLAALSGLEIDQAGFLEQKSRDLAAADLQRLLGQLIDETGASLVSIQIMPGADDEGIFPEATINVHVRSAIEAFQQLLYRLHAAQPLLFIDNLFVRKQQWGDDRARHDTGQLDISFDVTAFIYRPDVL